MSRNGTSYSTEGQAGARTQLVECTKPGAGSSAPCQPGAVAHIWNRRVVVSSRSSLAVYQVSGQPGICKILSQITQHQYQAVSSQYLMSASCCQVIHKAFLCVLYNAEGIFYIIDYISSLNTVRSTRLVGLPSEKTEARECHTWPPGSRVERHRGCQQYPYSCLGFPCLIYLSLFPSSQYFTATCQHQAANI